MVATTDELGGYASLPSQGMTSIAVLRTEFLGPKEGKLEERPEHIFYTLKGKLRHPIPPALTRSLLLWSSPEAAQRISYGLRNPSLWYWHVFIWCAYGCLAGGKRRCLEGRP